MAKEIDLIMNAKNAPAELTAAVTAHQVNYNKLLKAQANRDAANTAQRDAQAAFDKSAQEYQKQLEAWQVKA